MAGAAAGAGGDNASDGGAGTSSGGSSVSGGGGSSATGGAGGGGAMGGNAGTTTGGAGGGGAMGGNAGTTGSADASGERTGSADASGDGPAGTSAAYYIAGYGADTNPGTEALPFKTLTKGHEVAKAGTTLWVMAGTIEYATTMILSKSGTETDPIRVWAMPGARPILDYAAQPRAMSALRGIEVRGNYWHIKGLEIENASDNGIAISGSHNFVEDVVLHNNGDTGLQITANSAMATDDAYAAENLVLNCDSYENLDQETGGENADGFAAKLRIGPGNVFRGCRAWNNADDGWDLFAADDVVVIDDCWSFLNGTTIGGTNPAGDGNGFKLGGKPVNPGEGGAVHQVTHGAAFENKACGFTRNNNPEVPVVTGCEVHSNGTDYCSISCAPEVTITMTGAEAKAVRRNADGSLPAIH